MAATDGSQWQMFIELQKPEGNPECNKSLADVAQPECATLILQLFAQVRLGPSSSSG